MKKNKSLFRILSLLMAALIILSAFALTSCREPQNTPDDPKPQTAVEKFNKNLANYDERYANGIGDILILILPQGDQNIYTIYFEFPNINDLSGCFNYVLYDESGEELIEKAKAVYNVESDESYVRILIRDGALSNANTATFYDYLANFIPTFPEIPVDSKLPEADRIFLKSFYRTLSESNEKYTNGVGDIKINIYDTNGQKSYYVTLGYAEKNIFDDNNVGFYITEEQYTEFFTKCDEYFDVEIVLADVIIVVRCTTQTGTTANHVSLFRYVDSIMSKNN